MCGVGKLLSLSWRHQPCSWCQQVSLTSPHPEALFRQCLCNENLFRPVWGMRQRPQGSSKSLYLLLKGARWGGLFQHPNISVPLWSAFLLIHMQFLPRVYSCWTEESWGKEVYNPRHFVSFWGKCRVFLYRIKYIHEPSILEVFQGQRVCQFVFISHVEVKIWWEVNSQKPPHPSPAGRKQCIWSNLPEVSLRDRERWTPIYHH